MPRRTSTAAQVLVASLALLSACCSGGYESQVQELRETYRVGTPESEVRRSLDAGDEIDHWGYYEDERAFRAIIRDVGRSPFREVNIQILIQMDGTGVVKETEVKVAWMGI